MKKRGFVPVAFVVVLIVSVLVFVGVFVSNNNRDYALATTITNVPDQTGWVEKTFNSVNAQYVQFNITNRGVWIMLGELQVYDGGVSQSELININLPRI